MIDVRLLRTDFDDVRAALSRRHDAGAIDALVQARDLDVRLREIGTERDQLRSRVNAISKDVGGLRRDGKVAEAEALQAESRMIGETEKHLAEEHDVISGELRQLLLVIPNLPFVGAPDGGTDADNPVVVGPVVPDRFEAWQRVPHWETAADLGILDNDGRPRSQRPCSPCSGVPGDDGTCALPARARPKC